MDPSIPQSREHAPSDIALSQARFGADSHRWRFSYPALEDLSLYRLCHVDFPVMHWAPRRAEVERIVELAVAMHAGKSGKPTILEVGAGSGLLSYLMAETGKVDVIASDPDPEHVASTPYRSDSLRHVVADAAQAIELFGTSDIAVVLNSWMPPKVNLTPAIRLMGASAIVYVLEMRGETGMPETYANFLRLRHGDNLDDHVSYRPGNSYRRVCEWRGPAQWEITEWPKRHFYAESMRDSNKIDVQTKVSVEPGRIEEAISRMEAVDPHRLPRYPWEAELAVHKGDLPGNITRA